MYVITEKRVAVPINLHVSPPMSSAGSSNQTDLRKSTGLTAEDRLKDVKGNEETAVTLSQLLKEPGNDHCAECGDKSTRFNMLNTSETNDY